MPFSGNVPTLHRTRSPNGGAGVPCTRASEKSTLNCSARTSPPNVPAEVPIGSSTLPLNGNDEGDEGVFAFAPTSPRLSRLPARRAL